MNSEEKKTILLVEDEAIIAMNEKAALERYNYIVHHDNTGEKAVETIIDKALHIDLILMDIKIDGNIDCIETAAQIQKIFKDMKIVYLTAFADEKTRKRAKKTKPIAFLSKPSNPEVLQNVINKNLS